MRVYTFRLTGINTQTDKYRSSNPSVSDTKVVLYPQCYRKALPINNSFNISEDIVELFHVADNGILQQCSVGSAYLGDSITKYLRYHLHAEFAVIK